MSDNNEPKKTLDDYRIPGTNMVNWTAYSRENIPKDPPRYKVGDVVVFTLVTEVLKVGKDCDGTPLYELDMVGFGWSEEGMRPATETEIESGEPDAPAAD